MRFVNGSINFFPNRGSNGVKAPNCNKKNEIHFEIDYFLAVKLAMECARFYFKLIESNRR